MEQTYTWTYKVINSCNNDFHFGCADALIELFERKFGTNSSELFELKLLRADKWISVHGILA